MINHNRAFKTLLLQRLNTFLIALGLAGEGLRHQLAQRCLMHLSFVLPEVDQATATRIALNQVQHFFDHALATHMGLDVSENRNQLTVFRAQLLHQKIHTDFLFSTDTINCPSLTLTHEIAIPPESPLAMPKQTLAFAFRANSTTVEITHHD